MSEMAMFGKQGQGAEQEFVGGPDGLLRRVGLFTSAIMPIMDMGSSSKLDISRSGKLSAQDSR